MLLLRRSSKSSTFSDFPSKVGSDAVKAFGIGSAVLSFFSDANRVLATTGRSFGVGWL